MTNHEVFHGDCLDVLQRIENNSIDLAYLDPPFFTQKEQMLTNKDGKKFIFSDVWPSKKEYDKFLCDRLLIVKAKLKATGSIFFHCDKSASHIIRCMMDTIFGEQNFQSEIIWTFKRWSNSKKGLLPAHQNIYFYSKAENFKFNKFYLDYSPTTNIEQIMQKRSRDERNKSTYAKDEDGNIIVATCKKGVPLSDVWEMPYLNPKAKERVGYPTQKPVLLLERIIRIASNERDVILDPFCGSGTALIAAKLLGRSSIGIDISKDAVSLTRKRLSNPIKSNSALLKKGRETCKKHSSKVKDILKDVNYVPVQRNKGIDGLLSDNLNGKPAFFRVQRQDESILETIAIFKKATATKGNCALIVVQTKYSEISPYKIAPEITFIKEPSVQLKEMSSNMNKVTLLKSC